uniref:Transmembrane protein n=1 Tax=Heterorhabditis bacteriophora TaxID=37862 RepID=A0A1I7XCD5_HETBA
MEDSTRTTELERNAGKGFSLSLHGVITADNAFWLGKWEIANSVQEAQNGTSFWVWHLRKQHIYPLDQASAINGRLGQTVRANIDYTRLLIIIINPITGDMTITITITAVVVVVVVVTIIELVLCYLFISPLIYLIRAKTKSPTFLSIRNPRVFISSQDREMCDVESSRYNVDKTGMCS